MQKKDQRNLNENFLEKAGKLIKEFLSYVKHEVIPFISTFLDIIPYRKLRVLYPVALVMNVLLFIFIVYSIFFNANNLQGETDKIVEIRKGSGLNEIIEVLSDEKIIENEYTFKLAARITRKDSKILPRRYLFSSGLTNTEILELLTDKDLVQTIKFRVPEGVTIRKLSAAVEKTLFLSADKFKQATENREIIDELGLGSKTKNLEGFLFPDTYVISINLYEDGLVKVFTDEFKKQVLNDMQISSDLKRRNESLLKAITMASIIEAETYLKDEMPVISGVYHNRLRKRMRLEADPTVQYILPGGPKSRLLYEDLKIESPYNTYRNYGLPPGPINNPGINAIKAALNPASHNYVFFVATGEGGHTFSETYEQHKEAAREYRKKLNEKKK
jgi:UPF0755 protein